MLQAATQGVQLAQEVSHLFKGGRGKNRGRNKSGNEIVDISFVTQVTLSAGTASLSLADATLLSQDLVTLGTIYRFYRFREIELEFPAPNWSTAEKIAVMFADSAYATVPAFADSEARHMVLLAKDSTVPKSLRVPGKAMQGQVPWFLTQNDATEPSLDLQGKILFGAAQSSSEIIVFKFRARVEFKTLLDPTIMAARSLARTQPFTKLPEPMEGPPDLKEKVTDDEIRFLKRLRAIRQESDAH